MGKEALGSPYSWPQDKAQSRPRSFQSPKLNPFPLGPLKTAAPRKWEQNGCICLYLGILEMELVDLLRDIQEISGNSAHY